MSLRTINHLGSYDNRSFTALVERILIRMKSFQKLMKLMKIESQAKQTNEMESQINDDINFNLFDGGPLSFTVLFI